MAKMAGRVAPSWCWVCHRPSGPDCPDKGKAPRYIRRDLQRELRKAISRYRLDDL